MVHILHRARTIGAAPTHHTAPHATIVTAAHRRCSLALPLKLTAAAGGLQAAVLAALAVLALRLRALRDRQPRLCAAEAAPHKDARREACRAALKN